MKFHVLNLSKSINSFLNIDSIVTKCHPLNNTELTQEKYGALPELEREEIRILTFNLFMRPPPIK